VYVLYRSFLSTPSHAAVSFEIGGNEWPFLTQNQTLTVTNPDFVRLHRKYANRYVVVMIINKYKNEFYFYGRRQGNGREIQFRGLLYARDAPFAYGCTQKYFAPARAQFSGLSRFI
jgi:hypothetical protein